MFWWKVTHRDFFRDNEAIAAESAEDLLPGYRVTEEMAGMGELEAPAVPQPRTPSGTREE
jgi:hypothetical protein